MEKKFVVVICLSIVLFTANIGGISIYILDEAKNSTAAREMFDRSDAIVPTFNGELRTDKPPLHYYFMIIAYSIFGVNEFAARFFSVIFGIGTVIITYLFTKKFINQEAAFWSSLVLLSSIQVITQFHLAVPDPYLIFFFALSNFLAFSYYILRKPVLIYGAYAALALAVLAKGPLALVLISAVWFFFLITQKNLKISTILSFKPLIGILIILLITLPWYILVHIKTNGAWTEGFFLKHNVSRFTNTMEGHGGSFLMIPLFTLMGLFPFSIVIVQAFGFWWKKFSTDAYLTLSVVVSCVVVIFFSFSQTKLPNYPAPAFPFLAVILGTFLSQPQFTKKISIMWSMAVYLVLALAMPIAVYIVLEDVMGFAELKHLAFAFVAIPLGAIAVIFLVVRNNIKAAYYVVAISWILTSVGFYYYVFPEIDKRNPVYQALYVLPRNQEVYYSKRYNPAFSFYIKKQIKPIERFDSTIHLERTYVLTMRKELSEVEGMPYKVAFKSKEFFEPYYSIVMFNDPNTLTLGKTAISR